MKPSQNWTRTGRRTGIQLAYPLEEKRLAKWNPPFIVQPKLDGERCRAVIDQQGTVSLFSSEANVIESVPHITEYLQSLNLKSVEFDGELYRHGLDLNEIQSIVSTKIGLHPAFDDIQLHVFDLVDEAKPQASRIQLLEGFQSSLPSDCVEIVPFKLVHSYDEIMGLLDWSLEEGYEGVIVRHFDALYVRRRSIWMMKFKPKREDTYTIVGYTQEKSMNNVPKPSLGALVCQARFGEETFHVGTGFTRDQRHLLWLERETLVGKRVVVRFQHLTSVRGVPRSAVFAEILQ